MNCSAIDWLPELIDTDGAWPEICARLYSVFERDFKQCKLVFRGLPVLWSNTVVPGDVYEDAFWHLTSVTAGNDRQFDPARAQKLAWCAAILKMSSAPEVLCWEYREGNGRIRTYLWLSQCDYVVILEKIKRKWGEAFQLITGYSLTGSGSRRKMQAKFDNRER